MPRVKGSVQTRARRKKVLKLAKGYFGSKHTLYKTAHEQVMHSQRYAYRDRKNLKREMRKLWITRINAAARLNDISYSQLMYGLKIANVGVNRKMLSEIAIHDPKGFSSIVDKAKKAIDKGADTVIAEVVEAPVVKAEEKPVAKEIEAKTEEKAVAKTEKKKTAAKKSGSESEDKEKKPATKKASPKKETTAKKETADKKPVVKKPATKKTTTKKISEE